MDQARPEANEVDTEVTEAEEVELDMDMTDQIEVVVSNLLFSDVNSNRIFDSHL